MKDQLEELVDAAHDLYGDYWRKHPVNNNGWTLERQKRQAELIRTWKPWEKSTGPKTEEGKQKSAMRGYKGGFREKLREISRVLREYSQTLKTIHG